MRRSTCNAGCSFCTKNEIIRNNGASLGLGGSERGASSGNALLLDQQGRSYRRVRTDDGSIACQGSIKRARF